MSLAGLKKQFNKANQYVSEKMGAAEPTKLDEDFKEMERKTDITAELIENLILRTKEYLQPNPASRAKMSAFNSYAKMRGQARQHPYPQPEGVLGDTMFKYGGDLGIESVFGQSLIESGEALRQMAEVKYALEDQVRQSFLEPLHLLQTKDIKDLMFHRKKLEGRRLDFDCKKRKKVPGVSSAVIDDEIKTAEEKFVESKALAETAMYSLLDNEVEQVSQLVALVEAQVDYHKQNAAILETLLHTLYTKRDEATMKVREPRQPKPPTMYDVSHASPSPTPFDNGRESPENEFLDASPWGGGAVTASPTRSPSPLPSPMNGGGLYPSTRQTMTSDTPISFGSSLIPPPKGSVVPPVSTPTSAFTPVGHSDSNNSMVNGQQHHQPPVYHPPQPPAAHQPSCKALFDFEPENEGELAFSEGDIIILKERVDDNWFEGTLRGKTGVFPVTYVEVIVDVPSK